jgi:hypothetical protein
MTTSCHQPPADGAPEQAGGPLAQDPRGRLHLGRCPAPKRPQLLLVGLRQALVPAALAGFVLGLQLRGSADQTRPAELPR